MYDIPEHLSTLNHIVSPPSSAIAPEHEDAFWNFMHTDQLFDNFGVNSTSPAKAGSSANSDKTPKDENKDVPTLESFIAAFANDPTSTAGNFRLPGPVTAPLPLPLPFNAASSASSAPTPAAIDTSAILPFGLSPDAADRITGAKKLKQLGAGPAEIEEDKRRRNTEASARFRAKKKEREQALEIRAKELEGQVAQLVAEKASLENENKLLKAIVLGGQGGGELALGQIGQLASASANKRKRDE